MTRTATYRLQFCASFTFRDAAALVPYLHELGVSDLYASPVFKTRPGSSHGYDVADHGELSPDLGGQEGFDALAAALAERGMGLLLDIVPNHMGIGGSVNAWWTDVLENGRSSPYAAYFDIDWHPASAALDERVLLPILEDQYGRVLEDGKLRLGYEDGALWLHYHDHRLPIAPRSYRAVLERAADRCAAALGEDRPEVQELRSIATSLRYLPGRAEVEPERVAERYREKEVMKRRLAALCEGSEVVHAELERTLQQLGGTPGDPRSFDSLDEILTDQAYRLADWRVAADEINYRRFFDVNDLAAIRVEVPEVFQATHSLVLRLLAEGKATGVRVDHADGLWDPRGYLRELQRSYLRGQLDARGAPPEGEDRAALVRDLERRLDSPGAQLPLYVVVEKILSEDETLPGDWPCAGTTGYDFLAQVNNLLVDQRGEASLTALYADFTGQRAPYAAVVHDAKRLIMRVSVASEIAAVSLKLARVSERNRRYRDFTRPGIQFALREIIACLPVYRTYVGSDGVVSPRDQAYLEQAIAQARRRNERAAHSVFDFLQDTLLLRNLGDFDPADRRELIAFVMKLQQITGPVMAKGAEDTAFYVYNRLASLCEVGGSPARFGAGVDAFHAACAERQARWPGSLLTLSTHDTKRSADVRARIDVLSEMPDEWAAAVRRLAALAAPRKRLIEGEPAPDRNDEYLLYQALVGAWPEGEVSGEALFSFRERIIAYMAKATHEAKVRTSWTNPNEAYDSAVRDFVRAVLPDQEDELRRELRRVQRRVAFFGRFGALSQWLLCLCAPGVPDVYQGEELWALRLVDPDNRVPVDFGERAAALRDLRERIEAGDLAALADDLMAHLDDGRAKLYLIHRALGLRRARPALFSRGAYLPLSVRGPGPGPEHVCAFARVLEGKGGAKEASEEWIVAVAPRLLVSLTGGEERPPLGRRAWGGTRLHLPESLAGARLRDRLTGVVLKIDEGDRGVALADVLGRFPVALLEPA